MVGAILAVPLTAVLKIVVTELQHPYADFMEQLLEGKIGEAPWQREAEGEEAAARDEARGELARKRIEGSSADEEKGLVAGIDVGHEATTTEVTSVLEEGNKPHVVG